jgi:hypothetical protein
VPIVPIDLVICNNGVYCCNANGNTYNDVFLPSFTSFYFTNISTGDRCASRRPALRPRQYLEEPEQIISSQHSDIGSQALLSLEIGCSVLIGMFSTLNRRTRNGYFGE